MIKSETGNDSSPAVRSFPALASVPAPARAFLLSAIGSPAFLDAAGRLGVELLHEQRYVDSVLTAAHNMRNGSSLAPGTDENLRQAGNPGRSSDALVWSLRIKFSPRHTLPLLSLLRPSLARLYVTNTVLVLPLHGLGALCGIVLHTLPVPP